MQKEQLPWWEILAAVIKDAHEMQRLALAIRVRPVTLQRWVNQQEQPSEYQLRAILKAMPSSRAAAFARSLTYSASHLMNSTDKLKAPLLTYPPAEFYLQVLKAHANTPPVLYKQAIIDLILQQAIAHLDAERSGMMISVAICVRQPKQQIVHSLREICAIGTTSWERPANLPLFFLGADSLAGATVRSGQTIVIADRHDNHSSKTNHWLEGERSAIAAPLSWQGRIGGCLLVSCLLPLAHPQEMGELVTHYANLLALAFKPADFFDLQDIDLVPMPDFSVQRPILEKMAQRVTDILCQRNSQDKPLSLHQAQAQVYLEIEAQLRTLLPPHS